ncbi:amino acid adenylation domain-containing protein [Tolypothrix sp. PCC 7910]|uniref:non-ribosomal peptide synthetase n=1 Tax=Tolypothrix sp. PCC 7910 TaxID=2099387 RepID=UPI0014279C64|nr:non-ribosomal peptide synthetase [Tolypothrix sp. PCC 7910]QIR40545.1 amino acid adenylation domain-containing protein [Tolypothrix sp. PCC 7910]
MVATKNIEDVYPLSPMQAGMLFHSLLAPESSVYCEQTSFELHGELNISAFAQAWKQVIARHPILRTACVWENLEKPLQIVGRQVKFSWYEEDWRGIEAKEQQQKLAALLTADQQRGFELSQAPLMRLFLIRLGEQVYHFTWSHHHILLDGWSAPIIFQEVITYYKAYCQNKSIYLESPRPYRDYIAWLQQQSISQAEVFWRNLLKGFAAPTPIGIKPITQHSTDNGEQEIKLSATTTSALQSLAKQHQLTLNTLVQGAWALLLSRYSGEEDIVFGTTVSGRPPSLPKAEAMVGLFINTLPVRVQIDPEQFLLPWLKQLLAQQVEARQYEYTPLSDIQKWSDIPPGSPLFESIVVFENYPIEASLRDPDINLEIKNRSGFDKTNYPLTVSIVPGEKLLLNITYQQSDRLYSATIKRMLRHLQVLLVSIANNPHQRLKDLSFLTVSERHQLLIEWNNTEINYSQDKCIHQLFEAQVEKTPDAVAVVFENESLTYQELNQKANQLAHYLQKLGVKPEVLVGICVERSLAMIVGILGILKAGGAYLPLDPAYPKERLAFLLEDANTPLLLTQKKLRELFPQNQPKIIAIDDNLQVINQENLENLHTEVTSKNLAYIIYTSGSTGKPKGVMVEHQSLVNYTEFSCDHYQIESCDRILQFASICFDAAAEEIFPCIVQGATLVLRSDKILSSIPAFLQQCNDFQVTILDLPTAFWHQIIIEIAEHNLQLPEQLRLAIIGGEMASRQHLDVWQRKFNETVKLINSYGPTETTIVATTSSLNYLQKVNTAIVEVPIGKPINNTLIYILDSHLQPTPIGVTGEIYIGGIGVTRGYLNRPELTAAKFIPNHLSNQGGSRLYKTGDLARYLPNGEIEFIGRIDYQVKIRGFRIEIGEIQAQINQYPEVREAIVIVREDIPNDKRLVAYIVPQSTEISVLELRHFLKTKLPDYMIPVAFVVLEKLPLTPNGKIDRRTLPAPEPRQQSEENTSLALTPVQEILTGIWVEILGIKHIGIHDNFFELGGHSLLATRVISQIRKAFKIELPLRCLFASPTVAELATEIEQADLKFKLPNIEKTNIIGNIPLSYAQQRLWYLDQLETHNTAYNIFDAVRIIGSLDISALKQSFNEIIRRHEILRTNFVLENGQPIQVIAPSCNLKLNIIDMSQLSEVEREETAHNLVKKEAEKPFNLTTDPLLRVTLLRLADTEYLLLLTTHHIISDGWSTGILIQEIVSLYQAFSLNQPSPLPELPIQYADFAIWQHQWLQEEVLDKLVTYWQYQLKDFPTLKLKTDYPRAITPTYQGSAQTFTLSQRLSQQIKSLSNQQGVTLFMTLQAAFVTLMHYYSEQDDIVIGTDVANRNQGESEGLIGFFVNQLVLRTKLDGNPSFKELLERVRSVALDAYAHQDLPFDKLVEAINPERNLHTTPLFQVKLILQNTPATALNISGLTFQNLEIKSKTATFDLLFDIKDTEQGLIGLLKYSTDLFEADTISQMLKDFKIILSKIVHEPAIKINEIKEILAEADKQNRLTQEISYKNSLKQQLSNIRRKSVK